MGNNIIKLVLATSIATLVLVSFKTYQQATEITKLQVKVNSKSHQLIALDAKGLIDKFIDDGNSQAKAMEAFALLIKMMEDEGVLVISSEQTITAPTNKQFNNLRVKDIYAMAKKRGIDFEKFKKDIIEQAKANADEMIQQLESLQR